MQQFCSLKIKLMIVWCGWIMSNVVKTCPIRSCYFDEWKVANRQNNLVNTFVKHLMRIYECMICIMMISVINMD